MEKNNINLHILKASGKLTPYVGEIGEIFDETIDKVLENISVSNVDVVIVETSYGVIPEIGIGGQTYGQNVLFIYLDTKFPGFENKTLKEELPRSIAHELSHVIRWRIIPYGETLLGTLIWEGLADHFEMEINNKAPQAWSVALNANQISKMMKKVKEEYYNKDYDYIAWMFGSKEKGIPKWTGYTLGYKLVAEYLKKHPDKKPSQLHNLKAKEFIK